MSVIDYAARRVPQRFREDDHDVFTLVMRQCPLRPEKVLFEDEGPHALSWLAYRSDTVRLRGRA